jgi:hypothetical protein
MRRFLIPFLSLLTGALIVSPALASVPPLAPGKPAGLHQARMQDGTVMLAIGGAALVGIAIVLATAGNGPASPNTNPATSTTSTSP